MFVGKLLHSASRHKGVQRAAFSTILSKSLENCTLHKNADILYTFSETSRILYSSIPNNDSKNPGNTAHGLASPKKNPGIKAQVLASPKDNPGNTAQALAFPKESNTESNTLSRAQKLKKAIAEYGTTVIVFHVSISLISLGSCYLLVSLGLDINQILVKVGLSEWVKGNAIIASNATIASNAGTFAVAYAVHKVFAPIRMSITLASVPFIVRYLRQKGILRKPLRKP